MAEPTNDGLSPSQLIDRRIEELDDWRGETLARIRAPVEERLSRLSFAPPLR
jgi:hypothetical protein